MRKINTLVSASELKDALKILSGKDVKDIHLNLEDDITIQHLDTNVRRREQLYLFVEEFVPIEYLSGTKTISDSSKESILLGTYKTAVLPPKTKKLKELYNIRVYIGLTDGKISYKSINNLNNEILRILNKPKFSELKTFFNNHGITDYAREFLCINGTTPNMYRNKLILVYSALLNYNWALINTDIDGNGTTLVSIITNENIMSQNDLTLEKWSNLSKLFELFLDQLLVRTIHYDN